jgi:hypothetical protein
MTVNYAPFEGEEKVQVRSILLPKSIHAKIQRDAANEMRTITAQTVAILINYYADKEEVIEKK